MVVQQSAAYLPDDAREDSHADRRRKTKRIEDIRFKRSHRRDRSCIDATRARRGGGRIRADAVRRDPPWGIEDASGADTSPSRFQDRADDSGPSGAMGSGRLDRGALLSACAAAGLGQCRHRRALAEPDAQCTQFADLVVQASGFPRRLGDPWHRAACALRSDDLGQVPAHQTGGRRIHDQYADHRAEGGDSGSGGL